MFPCAPQVHKALRFRMLPIMRSQPTVLKARSTLELICRGFIDPDVCFPQHIPIMAETLLETPRRSSRIFKRVHVTAEGKNVLNRKFRESCKTIVINAHGALLYLK